MLSNTIMVPEEEDNQQEKGESLPLMLPKDFKPSHTEVLIGRGKKIFNHSGNVKFREMIKQNLIDYKNATCKTAKTATIAHIIRQVVSESSPEAGGFVRYNKVMKRWFAVDDITKRATTAQAFRDSLHSNYKSSKQNKRYMRLSERLSEAPSLGANMIHPAFAYSRSIASEDQDLTTEESIPALWEPSMASKTTQVLKDSLTRSLQLLESFDSSFQDNLQVPKTNMGTDLQECQWDHPICEFQPQPHGDSYTPPSVQKSVPLAEELEHRCLSSLFFSLEERLGDSTTIVSDPFEPVPMAVSPPMSEYAEADHGSDDEDGDELPEINTSFLEDAAPGSTLSMHNNAPFPPPSFPGHHFY